MEGNVVFTDLDAFDEDHETVAELKVHDRRGGSGDLVVKHRVGRVLRSIVGPIRERRAALARDPGYIGCIMDVPRAGMSHARDLAAATQAGVHAGLGLFTRT